MLVQLEITDLATFEKARISPSPGLNIISGMSGAGKSILLGALDLILGGRFSQKLIAEGKDSCEVAALFHIKPDLLDDLEGDRPVDDQDELLIRRQFKRDGKSLNYINDRLVSVDFLKQIGKRLSKTLSQDEALGLKDPEYQLGLLDAFSGNKKLVKKYQERYLKYSDIKQRIRECEAREQNYNQEQQFLQFQMDELSKLNLQEGELAEIEEEYKTLAHCEELQGVTSHAIEHSQNFLGNMQGQLERLRDLLDSNHPLVGLANESIELQTHIEEWTRTMSIEQHQLQSNPARLAEISERMRQLRAACKKYNMDHDTLVKHAADLAAKTSVPPPGIEKEKLVKELEACEKECIETARELHKDRIKKSKQLTRTINKFLEKLEMPGGRFKIEIKENKEPGSTGISSLQFMLAATADRPHMPLHETASGGERSRALLAISSALSGSMQIPLLIFDEIDTNIGSRLGGPISESFISLAKAHQIICVTHLAPVAASGEKHFLVEKGERLSSVTELPKTKRIAELAQMIAGEKDSKVAIQQAKHMLSHHA